MELSEEEKKAIEWLEKANYFSARLYAPTILNLINNYKKEIDREKQYSDFYKDLCNKLQKEKEEKRIIIFAGAEKVKQLEKGNRSLMESRIKWKNRYYKEKARNK